MYSVLQTTNFRTPASMKGCVFFLAIGMKLIKDRTLYLICVRKLQGITLDQSCSDGKTFSKAFVSAICVCTGRKRYNEPRHSDKVIFVIVATVAIPEEGKNDLNIML